MMTTLQKPQTALRVLALEATNFKKLKAISVDFAEGVTVIGGKNAQGKSSLLDSVFFAMGGRKCEVDRPVRDGQDKAEVVVSLGHEQVSLIVTRTATADGRTTLTVTSPEGAKFPSPQTMLDTLFNSFTFDPLEFSRQDAKKQLETLKALVGLDLSELDRERAGLYEERTLTGRDLTSKKGQLTSCVFHEDAPANEVDIQALSDDLTSAFEHNQQVDAFANKLAAMEVETERRKASVGHCLNDIERIELELRRAQEKLKEAENSYDLAINGTKTAKEKLAAMERKDTSAITSQLTAARDINAKVRDNARHAQVQYEVNDLIDTYEEFTAKINGVDERKRQALAAVTFPVEGLSFDETGVLFNGIPFSQASSAESLRVSVAMGAAMSPKFRTMFVKDGSLLDSDSMRLMAELAAEHDMQILMERVGTGEEVNVVIEEGLVAA